MHDDDLRLLIRDAIARHLGTSPLPGGDALARRSAADGGSGPFAGHAALPAPGAWKQHLSHGRFVFLAPTEPDAPCVVEPEVRCHHCGFCQSYGH